MPHVLFLAMAIVFPRFADDPPKAIRVIAPKDDGIIAAGINGRGDIVYFEWVEDPKKPGIVDQLPTYRRATVDIRIPLFEDYTSTFPVAVSDTGLVVGHVSKPHPRNGRVHLNDQAFVWDEKVGMRGLGALKEDGGSYACGISRDGTCISGYSRGDNRIRPCVWERSGDVWQAAVLPHEGMLGTQVVLISSDGKHIASVDGSIPCLWTKGGDGKWTREAIGGAGSLLPRAVNNAGTVVGLQHTGDGLTHAAVWVRGAGIKRLDEPEGYVKSEANAINNEGVIVGLIDGPPGSEIGPNAFIHEKGRTRVITEGGANFAWATAINDDRQIAGVMEKKEAKPGVEEPANREKP